ncbi:hypothetical protein BH10CHL1_BH10CHL1_12300 [soil metagenome]
MTSRYDISGALISSQVQLTGASTSPSYALVRGADVSRSLLGVMAQTEFTETTGGLLDFELHVSSAFGPFAEDDSFNTLEETPLSSSVTSNDSDTIDFYPLIYTKQSDISHGALTLNPDGSFVYTPALDYVGADGFRYILTNKLNLTDMAIVTITVANVNDAPVAIDDTATTIEEQPSTLAVLANDSDVDSGAILSLTAVGTPAHGSAVISGTTQIVYTPDLNFAGSDNFTYTVTDGDLTATATVTVLVTNVNDTPVATDQSYRAILEKVLSVSAPGVLSNASDVDADQLTALLVTGPSNGSLTLNADGSFIYTPNASYKGPDSFTYKANDGIVDSDVATISLTVTEPDATHTNLQTTPNPAKVGEQVTLTATVTGLARQMIIPTGTVTFEDEDTVLGTVALNAGIATLTKSDWRPGIHVITAQYQGDEHFARSIATAVQQQVLQQPVQSLPTAINDAAGTLQGQPVTITVLANDADPAGGGLTLMSITPPAHGVAAILEDGQTVTYTSTQDFQGTDNFSYTVYDHNGNTDTALVAVVVRAKSDTAVDPQIGSVDVATYTQLSFPGSQIKIDIILPSGVYTTPLGEKDLFYLAYTQNPAPINDNTENSELAPDGFRFGNVLFDLSAYLNATQLDHFHFTTPVTLTITYDPALLGLLEPETLTLLYWNGSSWADDGITVLARD